MDRMPCRITDEVVVDLMPRIDTDWYWVELLLDGGEQEGFAVEAFDEDGAIIEAMADAKARGLRPAEVVSVTLEAV